MMHLWEFMLSLDEHMGETEADVRRTIRETLERLTDEERATLRKSAAAFVAEIDMMDV